MDEDGSGEIDLAEFIFFMVNHKKSDAKNIINRDEETNERKSLTTVARDCPHEKEKEDKKLTHTDNDDDKVPAAKRQSTDGTTATPGLTPNIDGNGGSRADTTKSGSENEELLRDDFVVETTATTFVTVPTKVSSSSSTTCLENDASSLDGMENFAIVDEAQEEEEDSEDSDGDSDSSGDGSSRDSSEGSKSPSRPSSSWAKIVPSNASWN